MAENEKKKGGWKQPPYDRSGNDLLSRTVTRAVPSALEGLTAEFGMGSGVTPPLWSPEVTLLEVPPQAGCAPLEAGCQHADIVVHEIFLMHLDRFRVDKEIG